MSRYQYDREKYLDRVANDRHSDNYLDRHTRNRAAEYELSLELQTRDQVEPDPFTDDLGFASLIGSLQRQPQKIFSNGIQKQGR